MAKPPEETKFRIQGSRPRKHCQACESALQRDRYWAQKGTPPNTPDRTEVITLHERAYTVGWMGDTLYWPVKPFVEAAGLSWGSQNDRIQRDPNLQDVVLILSITSCHGKDMLCLPWSHWHAFWMGTQSPKVEKWRKEAYAILRLVAGETVQEVIRDVTPEQRIIEAAQRIEQPNLWQPTESGLRGVIGEETEAAFERWWKKKQITEITREIELPVDGRVYIAEADPNLVKISRNLEVLRRHTMGWRYIYISQSGRVEEERLAEYNPKNPLGTPPETLLKRIRSDQRKKLENALHKHLPVGVWRVPGKHDEFMVSPDALALLLALPDYIASCDIHRIRGWSLCEVLI